MSSFSEAEGTKMTDAEAKALKNIAATTDPAALRRIASNARGRSELVERAALRRLATVSAKHEPGTLEHDCWTMVHAVEELRRLNGRKVSRMNRMRPKIESDGEVAALEYCALKETDGFAEILEYGMPELTAEAVVLRHRRRFSDAVVQAAQARLKAAGVLVEE
jgi:hypothetical protein